MIFPSPNISNYDMTLPIQQLGSEGLSMNGKIKAENPRKCPKCKKAWVDTGNDLLCPTSLTRPNRFYIHLGYNGVNLRL
jgi:hypothetical protein